jgi:adenosylcobinamide-GDP ribazoletransferase
VGLVLGALLTLTQAGLERVLPATVTAVLLVALWALLTGALHLDGVADLFDGLGGGRGDPARMLAIMRDSRIGAHGAVALVLTLLCKVSATSVLVERRALWPLLAAPVVARWAVVQLIAWVRYAREQGVGQAFTAHIRRRDLILASVFALACLSAFGPRALYPTLAALLGVGALGAWLRAKLVGLTGDVYGAAIELGEVVFLVASLFDR